MTNTAAAATANSSAKVVFDNGWQLDIAPASNQVRLTDTSNAALLAVTAGGGLQLASNKFGFNNVGLPNKSNNITLVGQGFPLIIKNTALTLNTNVAPTALSYTPPATAGVYRLSGYLDVLTAGTMTFKVIIGYTDPGGNGRTDVPGFYLQNTTAIVAGGNSANTTGQYVMQPYTFAIDNSATAITIGDNAGTYTAGTYYWTAVLEQLI